MLAECSEGDEREGVEEDENNDQNVDDGGVHQTVGENEEI